MKNIPDFFLVGAAKAGTTAIQQALDVHPDVFMSPLKEPNFFCDDILVSNLREDVKQKLEEDDIPEWISSGMKTDRWRAYLRDENLYSQLFDAAKPNQKKGEASVSYLYSLNAAQNIFKANANAKIIIVLRNPAERAFSHFNMEQRMNWIQGDFSSAFQKYKLIQNPIWGKDPLFVAGGLYSAQVSRYFNVFPKSKILVLIYDEFKKAPEKTLAAIFNFINVDASKIDLTIALKTNNEARENKIEFLNNAVPKGALKIKIRRAMKSLGIHRTLKNLLTKPSSTKITKDERTIASEYYLDDIYALEKLLNINLDFWKK
jgi:hypothetical protein